MSVGSGVSFRLRIYTDFHLILSRVFKSESDILIKHLTFSDFRCVLILVSCLDSGGENYWSRLFIIELVSF